MKVTIILQKFEPVYHTLEVEIPDESVSQDPWEVRSAIENTNEYREFKKQNPKYNSYCLSE
jgi:hypothetical protein